GEEELLARREDDRDLFARPEAPVAERSRVTKAGRVEPGDRQRCAEKREVESVRLRLGPPLDQRGERRGLSRAPGGGRSYLRFSGSRHLQRILAPAPSAAPCDAVGGDDAVGRVLTRQVDAPERLGVGVAVGLAEVGRALPDPTLDPGEIPELARVAT